eukprot:556209-Prymnesium_polylepis.1
MSRAPAEPGAIRGRRRSRLFAAVIGLSGGDDGQRDAAAAPGRLSEVSKAAAEHGGGVVGEASHSAFACAGTAARETRQQCASQAERQPSAERCALP